MEKSMSRLNADVAIVGAGAVGLAHAYTAALAGKSVVVFERNAAASGASIRNFGLIWPIGQPHGEMLQMALASRATWKNILDRAKLPYFDTGSLHLAFHDDEEAVAQEFASLGPNLGYRCQWIPPDPVSSLSPCVRGTGLRGALFSPMELTIDPRLTIARLPAFLAETYGVRFRFGHAVRAIELPHIRTAEETWHAERVIVCCGDDFETLYPETFRDSGITRCKLQMLRTAPQPEGFALGPALAAGLTLRFYPSFQICSTLSAYRARIAAESPEYDRWGIHVMASQTAAAEITIGDSHEYGSHIDIFNREEVDQAILGYLGSFLQLPQPAIAQRWYGVYAKHPSMPFVRSDPAPGVTVVTALGGAGMTLSFGLADQIWRSL